VPLFEMTSDDLVEHRPETFAHLAIREREGLQRILRTPDIEPGPQEPVPG